MGVSQNGWPLIERAIEFTVPGTRVRLPLAPAAAPLLLAFAAEWNRLVEPLVVPGCWGWNKPTLIPGTDEYSNHCSGSAIDLNAPKHPWQKRGTVTPAQAATIRALAAKYGLRWGGDYRRVDEMHTEIVEHPNQVAARIQRMGLDSVGNVVSKTSATLPGQDWSDMATKDEIKAAFREVLEEPLVGNDDGPGKVSVLTALYRAYSQSRKTRVLVARLAAHLGVRMDVPEGTSSEAADILRP